MNRVVKVLYVGKRDNGEFIGIIWSGQTQPLFTLQTPDVTQAPAWLFCVSFAVGSRYVEEAHDRAPAGCAHPDAAE